ncbi:MAG TPA: nitrilase-related carbon-nitrogen hydrolase [Nitrospira sp.]|nr:nitrilase-related carbon-nitrogen hydrolase [Nitrospira sp.]
MRIGYYQNNPVFGKVSANLDRIVTRLDDADAELMVLPELCASGYQFTSRDEVYQLSESISDGPTVTRLLDVARRKGMVIVAGLPERFGSRCYNSAAVIGPQGVVGCYRKTHLFFEETLFFTPGDTGFQVWDIGPAKIGVMICFDWYYPESARTLALKGADILCHPSNLVLPNCPDSMPVRCLENRVFAVTCNRIGEEARGGRDKLAYIGQSQIVNPRGAILHRSPRAEEELWIADIDPGLARDKTVTRYNDLLRDRREECYR